MLRMLVIPDDEVGGRCATPFALRGRPTMPDERVDNIIILVSHVQCDKISGSCSVDANDVRLLERYAQELRHQPSTAIWMLLFREGYDELKRVSLRHMKPGVGTVAACATCSDGIAMWGEHAIWKRFPSLGAAVARHPFIKYEEPYLQRYYWFHAVLPLWLERYGECYPHARYIWRMETDVLWAGTVDTLVTLGNSDSADLLLPELHVGNTSRINRAYFHFQFQTFILPPQKQVWALVCVARYSRRFLLETMTRQWSAGSVGYEEILLPTSCLNTSNCRLSQFSGRENVAGNHVQFRVLGDNGLPTSYKCEDFRDALTKGGTLDLWHPVKDHRCLQSIHGQAQNLLVRDDHLQTQQQQRQPPPQPPQMRQQQQLGGCTCPTLSSTPPISALQRAQELRELRQRSVAWTERYEEAFRKKYPNGWRNKALEWMRLKEAWNM